ncbi:VCBS domain-containing protein [Pseudomonas marincola]|uniref:VCBS domain-containing protein n=1 Tax=Pseudomonas marincola TaxID=437900 RepID=UPI0008DFA9F3|nr:VCBS domain-containing protein [Pseudomonas marincola]SFT90885.1 VCBS repeat-containing protein [Pseudomonas marincola]
MQSKPSSSALNVFRPRSQALALEQRILFDGAAVAAVDQQHNNTADAHESNDTAPNYAAPTEVATAKPTDYSAAKELLVVDSRVENANQLTAQLPANVRVLVVNTSEDGLAAISSALTEMGKVDSIQILSHGSSGQFTLGNRTLSSDNVGQLSGLLSSWSAFLNQGADIQLYGCNVGSGEAGRVLVSELARITGADVGASSDDTGSAALGGDWDLEVRSGNIDKALVLGADVIDGYANLLADASPTVTLSSAGQDVLLGDQFTFTVNFSNNATDATALGYAPFLNVIMPATGVDGDDGATFISATYLGQSLSATVITFDASGNATHPLAKDASGNPLIITGNPGDQLVVIALPFASISKDQPALPIVITGSLSNLADTDFSDGSPDLTIKVSSGFELGNDSLDNPTDDPSIVMPGFVDFVIHPTVITFDQTLSTPEGETVTGPNHNQSYTVTVNPAPGQTLTNVVITQPLPDNIQVTAITPGAGGVITSLTLYDGTTVTDPAEIQAAIAADDVYISSFSVEYANLTGSTDTVVSFYVPEVDSSGLSVLDPVTGAPRTITIGPPTAEGSWVPIDPRDVTAPATTIEFSGTGNTSTFIAKSLTLEKQVDIQIDEGTSGVSPGDTLQYTLDIEISDYFAYGRDFFNEGSLLVTDTLGDGQSLVPGSATMSVTIAGVTQSIALVSTVTTDSTTGISTIVFDIAQSLRDAFGGVSGWLNGDLSFDDVQEGATRAVITYSSLISQAYSSPADQQEINEGDSLSNSAILSGTVLTDRFNVGSDVAQTDTSSASVTVPTNRVDISIASVNNGTPPANGEIRPGDVVTFELSYDLVTGDYENFILTAYLPEPLLDVSGVSWTQGTGVGTWTLGADNTNNGAVLSVTTGPGNSVVFDFGDYATSDVGGTRIVVQFTVLVGNQPFADQRSLDVLAQSSQQTTLATQQTLVSSDVVAIVSVAEPELSITHGVVSSSNGTISGTTGTWQAPGTTGAPFTGSVTDPLAVNGDVTGIDAGDTLRLATAIENTGGGGAFDVTTSITLPSGLSFVGGSLAAANLQIYRGDGTLLVLGTDYSVSGNAITFLDAGSTASLLAGRAGTAADASGANVVIITYDATVDTAITASSTLQSTATLSNYASVDGGTDFTPNDLTEVAGQQIAAPEIRKVFADGSLDDSDSSATHTSGNDLVIGESMLYDIVVTLPEGGTQNLRIEDLIPQGMRLDTSFGMGGYELILLAADSGALSADFAGNVVVGTFTAVTGALGDDGGDVRFTFTASTTSADNNTGNNSFVLRVRLVASNISDNQANKTLQNNAQLIYSDVDGDTPNGTTPVDRTVALTGGQPSVVIREPTLTIDQTTVVRGDGQVDEGDLVEYIISISNGSSSNDFDAFDISFLDNLPSQLGNVTLISVVYNDGTTTTNITSQFTLTGNVLQTVDGANIDIVKGGVINIRVGGIVNATAASVPSFDNVATVQWTSLDGTTNTTADPAGERTGADGLLNSGALNDYRSSSTINIPVSQKIGIARVGGLPDTAAPDPTFSENENVAVGEIIRYRVSAVLAEGTTDDYSIRVSLGDGLEFLNDGTVRISFTSNDGITSSVTGVVTPDGIVIGNQTQGEVGPIDPNLSGPAPQGLLNAAQIEVIKDPTTGETLVIFHLGDITVNDRDVDFELITIEFNAKVQNIGTNVAGASISARAADFSGDGPTPLSESPTLTETIVESSFTGMVKEVVSFNPDTASATNTGTATVAVSFTQNGQIPAFDAQLTDSFANANASNYTLISIQIGGTTYLPGALPAGVSFTDGGSISVDFTQIDPNVSIKVLYSVTLPNDVVIATSDATLTWTSLPEDFTSWGGSSVGADGTEQGERTGEQTGANNYILTSGAGIGVISGTLWNDTGSADDSVAVDGAGLAGQTVTLTWAGTDDDLTTTADNLTFQATTDANGFYQFGVLPAGIFQIDTPKGTISYAQPIGDLRVRIDSDGTGGTLGQVVVTLGEGGTGEADAGYVELNDAPVITLPGTQNGQEDVLLAIDPISIADVDADRYQGVGSHDLQVTLSVVSGTLSLSNPTPTGVTVSGSGKTLILTGTQADLNEALKTLQYLGDQDFNGTDTLTVVTSDLGSFGEADGNCIPNDLTDALTDTETLSIVLEAVNDAPQANDNSATAVEAGGTDNSVTGVNPRGNLITDAPADTDVDIATNADELRVTNIGFGGNPPISLPSTGAGGIQGNYGTLFVNAAGGYIYVVDNDNPAVEALRISGQTLAETFTYTIKDIAGASSTANLFITIQGANDTPVGVDDVVTVAEAGGVNNGQDSGPASGNVILGVIDGPGANTDVSGPDTDVDSAANGEVLNVSGIRVGAKDIPGDFDAVTAGSTGASNGTVITGLYGTLTIGADGSYTYVVDNDNADVQQMIPGDTLQEIFSYRLVDAGALDTVAQLTVIITGAYDNPVASDDAAEAQAASTNNNAQESNPTGNVITFPSRPGNSDQPGGNGIDLDVDRTDQPSDQLIVTGIRVGVETASGNLSDVSSGSTSTANGTVIVGTYGTLTIGADGSFIYDVDSTNTTVQGLAAGETLTETFTYQITDTGGLTDLGQLVITVKGVNDPPVAQNVVALAVENGGLNNTDLGRVPSGDATTNAFDPDGDPITVTSVRTGPETGGVAGTENPVVDGTPTSVLGTYGTLTINADGSYTYALDNSLDAVKSLRLASQTLTERFTYTISDGQGEVDVAEIIVVISGKNDNPVGAPDIATAKESGGVNNNQAGIDPTGNVLTNDTDEDGVNYGETAAVSRFSNSSGTAGTLGSELKGLYGWLRLNADGSYTYRVDNNLPAVQALRSTTDELTDVFNYSVIDRALAEGASTLTITIQGANDTPVAVNDANTALEAGGTGNATPGINPTGNVLTNDRDVDAGDVLSVTQVSQGANTGAAGTDFIGTFGTLRLNADGSYEYVVNNDNAQVQALRTTSNTLTDVFTYRVRDLAGATTTALLTITIQGANDTPVAINDTATAREQGGTLNAVPGINPSGNVLNNDTDVDASDAKIVTGIRTGTEAAGGALNTVIASNTLTGIYGTLTIASNGSYTYTVDNNLASVQALKAGEQVVEVFTYRMRDTAGATDLAQLTITVQGAWDAPVAVDDIARGVADNGLGNSINPTGNALTNDTDVDNNDSKTVTGIRLGAETSAGTLAGVTAGTDSSNGTLVDGLYGQLIIGADGSFTYVIDTANPAVLALPLGQTLRETFTYEVTDGGSLTDLAQIQIVIFGRNDAPVANTDTAEALEAGGLNNASPGVNPSGNVLSNDTDLEDNVLTVTDIRTGTESGTGTAGTVGTVLRGQYGDLQLNSDGTWTYTVDNSLAAVQALRTNGQTLTDVFTYRVQDFFRAGDSAELQITVRGNNDTPIASDDAAVAIEAGGVANSTPGLNPSGNVLDNDNDVDSVANGETKQVLLFTSSNGNSAAAGQVVKGLYGSLTINANGSYTYVLDNNNPVVQALRTAGNTLNEVFTYRMSDTAGATSDARLSITIQGADDNPVAVNDSVTATDQTPAPQATGNVLPNDSDVDSGDQIVVSGVRTGAESGSGTAGVIGQPIQGLYGTLILNADGSYTYTIDLTNPTVLAAAGLGQVLDDVFTYTITDLSGATDQAELVINLNISAPYIPAGNGPHFDYGYSNSNVYEGIPDREPIVFVSPVVERSSTANRLSNLLNQGTNVRLATPMRFDSPSIGAGLGLVDGQFVGEEVQRNQEINQVETDAMFARHGRISLSANGLLSSPSLFAESADQMLKGPYQSDANPRSAQTDQPTEQPRIADAPAQPTEMDQSDDYGVAPKVASGFREQLRAAAQSRYPFARRDA